MKGSAKKMTLKQLKKYDNKTILENLFVKIMKSPNVKEFIGLGITNTDTGLFGFKLFLTDDTQITVHVD